jgi:hypothetical protein
MALVNLSGVINAADLNNNFQDKITTLISQNSLTKTQRRSVRASSIIDTTSVGLTSITFEPQDDEELVLLGITVGSGFGGLSVTVELEAIVVNSDNSITVVNKYTGYGSLTVNLTTVSGIAHGTRNTGSSSSDAKVFLAKGTQYRLKVYTTSTLAIESVEGYILTKLLRRRQ